MKNCLPVTIHYTIGAEELDTENTEMQSLEPGQSGHLRDDRSGRAFLHMKIFEFRQTDWNCSQNMEAELAELSTWRFTSNIQDGVQAKMDLGVYFCAPSNTKSKICAPLRFTLLQVYA